MNPNDRKIVEAMKDADHMTISIKVGADLVTLHCGKDRKLFHDIAIAYQSAVIARDREVARRRQSGMMIPTVDCTR